MPTPARDFPPIFFPNLPRIRHWFFVNNAPARARVYGSNTRRENGSRPAGGPASIFQAFFSLSLSLSISVSRAQRDVRHVRWRIKKGEKEEEKKKGGRNFRGGKEACDVK